MATTTYSINVRYDLQDNTSKPAGKIDKSIQRTTRSSLGLTRALKGLAVTVAAGFGFRAGKKWLIDYNAEMDSAKIKMATLTSLSLGGTWIENQKRANALVRQFTADAAKGVGTTQDYVEFAGDITKPLLDAGASMKQLTELTKSGVTAAKTFGIAGDVAGRDIQQMLLGTVKLVDRLPRLLGTSAEEWNKMVREEGPEKTLQELERLLNSKSMQEAAAAYGKSWDGVTSTMEDNIQRTLGKVGLPLMKRLSEEVKKVNKFFEENPEKVQKFITDFSDALIKGFEVVKSVISFIIENKDVLMSIAKAFIGFKIAKGALGVGRDIVGGGAQAVSGGIGIVKSIKEQLKDPISGISIFRRQLKKGSIAVDKFAGRLGTSLNTIGKFGLALGAGIAAIKLAEGFFGRKQAEAQEKALTVSTIKLVTADLSKQDVLGMEEAKKTGIFSDISTHRRAKTTARSAVEEGFLTAGKVKMTKQQIELFRSQDETLERTGVHLIDKARDKATEKFVDAIERAAAAIQFVTEAEAGRRFIEGGGIARGFSSALELFNITGPEAEQKPRDAKRNGDTNITINTIKVVADDPDRFAMRMVSVFKNANVRPVSPRSWSPSGRPT